MIDSIRKRFTKSELYVILAGVVLRVFYFVCNLIMRGNHIDEVMTTLNGISLARNMTDIAGERLPVYFDTWLYGGQSPLPTYITALAVKLFGHSLFAVRLPVIITCIIGFIVFCAFVKELFGDSKYSFVIIALGCISPWMIFSGVFLLDCNFMSYFIIVALYFFARALNTAKLRYYVASMVCFGLGFYCYMASVFVIPFMLAAAYLTLLIKKKIGFKELTVSVVTITVVAIPFILFGLVALGVIPPFKLLGFSFSEMPYYGRATSTAFSGNVLTNIVVNLASSFTLLLLVDSSLFSLGLNIFQFGNLFAGFLFVFGVLKLAFSIRKERKSFSFNQKLFCLAMLAGIISFCAFNNDPRMGIFYRYATLTPLFLPIEGIGLVQLVSLLKKMDYKKAIAAYLCLSFVVLNVQFFYLYNKSRFEFDVLYTDDFYQCLDTAEEKDADKIVIYENDRDFELRLATFLRYYYTDDGEVEFVSTDEEFYHIIFDLDMSAKVTTDDYIEFRDITEPAVITDDYCIVSDTNLENVTYDETYTVAHHGQWNIIYR